MTCKIERIVSPQGFVILQISGRIDGPDIEILRELMEREEIVKNSRVAIDLRDVTLISRNAIRLLSSVEARGTELRNCPAYIRDWVSREREGLVIHQITQEDSVAVAALRSAVASMKGKLQGIAARDPFNGVIERVSVPEGTTFEADTVGGISGWWVRPVQARKGAAIMHVHGGWFNWGSAKAFRNFVGHIALHAGTDSFVPDYRLAPEHPFPAAVKDVEACYRGLVERGIRRIALTGDSAGGNLALVLLSIASAQASGSGVVPVGAVALSPVTDLALSGESFETRAEADPYFTKSQAVELVRSYLGGANPKNPLASPLYGDLSGMPPIRVHVGDDEVLLDDSRRYVDRTVAAGVDATLDVWIGMPHAFVTDVGRFDAATQALHAIGAFLTERLGEGDAGSQ
jgi:monoterpene epsilon-lactone hydrolase